MTDVWHCSMNTRILHSYASPAKFSGLIERLQPWLGGLTLLLGALGLYFALFASPEDYQQGQAVRIMYVHVPAAWMSMGAYMAMAVCSFCYLVWRHPVADVVAQSSALPGAIFTAITLATGMLWGKPMWGAWWVWDARLTSVLILFFLYIGYLALADSLEEGERKRKSLAVLSLIGAVNLPIIKFSVDWWNTLHQPASLIRMSGPAVDGSMLLPLLLLIGAFTLFYFYILCIRSRAMLLEAKVRRAMAGMM